MKKLLFLIVGLTALAACKQKGPDPKDLALAHQRDSLNRIIAMKDTEITDMMSTMNDIVEGFQAINEAEDRLTLVRSDEGASSTERIRENLQFIQQTMQQNRELINKLRNQLRQSTVNGEQFRRTIDNLTRQMEEKDAQLKQLQADLQARDIQIGELTEQVSDLNSNITTLQQETSQKTQTISSQDKQLNTAWFVFGTSKELKEHNVLVKGKVLQGDFDKSYFTKIDIRIDKEIKLYSKSANILTAHPASAYTLERDANKQYILRINDPQLFWSTSKYLVVQVK